MFRGFRETLRILISQQPWRRLEGRRHLLVSGQGRGANSGFIWRLGGNRIRNCTPGWIPRCKRVYESILCGAIPVFIPGSFVPPFLDRIDSGRFSLTMTTDELPFLEEKLRTIPMVQVQGMLAEVAAMRNHFIHSEASWKSRTLSAPIEPVSNIGRFCQPCGCPVGYDALDVFRQAMHSRGRVTAGSPASVLLTIQVDCAAQGNVVKRVQQREGQFLPVSRHVLPTEMLHAVPIDVGGLVLEM